MKIFILIISFLCAGNIFGQTEPIRKYFDSSWVPVSKADAFYYTDFAKEGAVYKCVSYYAASDKLFGTSTFADTLFRKGIGLMRRYYETGELLDSSFFDAQGVVVNQFVFHKNGKLNIRTSTNRGAGVTRIETYDDKGKPDPRLTIILNAPEFKDGIPGWQAYLEKNLNTRVPLKNKAPVGMYTVVVSFMVGEDGRITEIKPENDPGYGTTEEAIRVIEKAPKWKPAMQNGKPVTYKHKQHITFQVTEK